MDTFAGALTALMTERGISQRGLAARVYCDRALICRYRTGKQQPSARMAAAIDEALDADGALKALAGPGRRAVLTGGAILGLAALDPGSRERLAWAQRHPRRIDQAAVDSLAVVLAAQRRADDAVGSASVIKAVIAQLSAVEDLVTEACGPVRSAVVDIAQQWAQFTAHLHISVRDFPAARALCRQALELAAEADDATMTTTVLRLRGYMAWLAGEPGPAIGLAQAAQRDHRAAASERAYGATLEASGYALTGDARAAEHKLGEALSLAGQLETTRSEHQRPWSYWYTTQWFECQRGLVLGHLSAHADRYLAPAINALTTGYEGLGAGTARSEWGTDYLLHR